MSDKKSFLEKLSTGQVWTSIFRGGGVPQSRRQRMMVVLNSVFLHHCVKAGLDTAIVNSEKLVRYSQVSEEERQLCNDLLWYRANKSTIFSFYSMCNLCNCINFYW